MRPWLAVTISTLVLIGCDTRNSATPKDNVGQTRSAAPQPLTAPSLSSGTRERAAAETDALAPEEPMPSANPAADAAAPAMIIRTGTASIEVDTLEPAVAQVHQLTLRLGGYIANISLQD